ncbi:MAG: ferritin-like domain-containing protein [Candidatus Natronoplasma sp.]
MGEEYTIDELKEFKPLDTKVVLAIAWRSEITAQEMYRDLMEKIDDRKSYSLLQESLKEEKVHEKKIMEKFQDFFPDESPKDIVPDWIVFSESIDQTPDSTEDILKTAREAEKKAERFYHSLSKEVEDQSASRLLSYLAYQENEHHEKLKKRISERGG